MNAIQILKPILIDLVLAKQIICLTYHIDAQIRVIITACR